MIGQRLMWIAWPSFLMAAVLEMVIFAVVDPSELQWSGSALSWSREAVYTLSFFIFWMLIMLSSALTTLLSMSPFEVNRCPVDLNQRPPECANGSCNR